MHVCFNWFGDGDDDDDADDDDADDADADDDDADDGSWPCLYQVSKVALNNLRNSLLIRFISLTF